MPSIISLNTIPDSSDGLNQLFTGNGLSNNTIFASTLRSYVIDARFGAELANNSIDGSKTVSLSITPNKLVTASLSGGDGSTTGQLAYKTITENNIANGAIKSILIDAGAVTSDKIANTSVSNAKLSNAAALSVKGNASSAAASPSDIVAGSDNNVLLRSNNAISFGKVTPDMVTFSTTPYTPPNVASYTIQGRISPNLGAVENLTGEQARTVIGAAAASDVNARVLRAGDVMTGYLTLYADPTVALHSVTKQYVDGLANTLNTLINTLSSDMKKIGNNPYLEYAWVTTPAAVSQDITANTLNVLTLNTEVVDLGGFGSLNANQITLSPGTYMFEAFVMFYCVSVSDNVGGIFSLNKSTGEYITRTNCVPTIAGARDTNTNYSTTVGELNGQFTLTSSTVLELKLMVPVAANVTGFKDATTVYTNTTTGADQRTTIKLWKVG